MNIAFDIDGTICFDGNTIDESILVAISSLFDEFNVFFASARHPRDISRLLPAEFAAKSIFVGANGAVCKQQDTVLFKKTIELPIVDQILEVLEHHKCAYLIDGIQGYYKSSVKHDFFKVITPHGTCIEASIDELKEVGVVKFLVLPTETHSHSAALTQIKEVGGIEVHNHSDHSFDITVNNVDKYSALCEGFNIDRQLLSFGNDLNDLSLFKNSRYSFLVGNNEKLISHANERLIPVVEGQRPTEQIVAAINRIKQRTINW